MSIHVDDVLAAVILSVASPTNAPATPGLPVGGVVSDVRGLCCYPTSSTVGMSVMGVVTTVPGDVIEIASVGVVSSGPATGPV